MARKAVADLDLNFLACVIANALGIDLVVIPADERSIFLLDDRLALDLPQLANTIYLEQEVVAEDPQLDQLEYHSGSTPKFSSILSPIGCT